MAVDKQDPYDFDQHGWPEAQETKFDQHFKIIDPAEEAAKKKAKKKGKKSLHREFPNF